MASSTKDDKLGAFTFHGVDLSLHGKEAVGDCPFCEKSGHFYASAATGQWSCKRCGESGNAGTFLRKLWSLSQEQTTEQDFRELSEQRGIPPKVLREWGLAKSLITGEWLLPIDHGGEALAALSKCNDRLQVRCTTGAKQLPFGDFAANKNRETLWVCEGPWDGMAWDSVLRTVKENGKPLRLSHSVVAIPGAGLCHAMLPTLCDGRHVRLLLDNDEAGRNGTNGIIKALADSKFQPKSVNVLCWDEDREEGFDIRDLVCELGEQGAYDFVTQSLAEPNPETDNDTATLCFRTYDQIQREEIRWLWRDRIPLGKITLLQGNPGVGKSYVACDLVARVSAGRPMPDGSPATKGEVVFFTSEDGASDTIRPRLDVLGANVASVYHFDAVERDGKEWGFDLSRNLPDLRRWLGDHRNVKLLVYDPLVAFLSSKTDSHKNAEVRQALGPIKQLAEEFQIAILGINHLNKSAMKAVHRGQGSIAFTAQARAVWQVCEDPDEPERRLFLPVKMNLAKTSGLAFQITGKGIAWEKGSVDLAPDDVDTEDHGETRIDEAREWLSTLLGKEKQLPAKEVFRRALADRICTRTLKKAKKALSVRSDRQGDVWRWSLPVHAPDSWGKGQEALANLKKALARPKPKRTT